MTPATGRPAEEWVKSAADRCERHGVESPRLSAELILCRVQGIPRARWLAQRDEPLSEQTLQECERLLSRRIAHEPMAYLLGTKPFRNLELIVNPSVLIPRPETEELVDLAADWVPTPRSILDAGTGSGCIALGLADLFPAARVVGLDRSREALLTARQNDVEQRIQWVQSDWLTSFADQSFDLVVSNPPYVTSAEMIELEPQVRLFEPSLALDGGPDGCDAYRLIVPEAFRVLKPRGGLAFEGGPRVMPELLRLLASAGFDEISSRIDLAGRERFAVARRP